MSDSILDALTVGAYRIPRQDMKLRRDGKRSGNGCNYCSCGLLKSNQARHCINCYLKGNRPADITDVFLLEEEPCNYLALTRGKYAIVDATEYESVSQWAWYAIKPPNSKTFYAARDYYDDEGNIRTVLMHQFLIGGSSYTKHIDHKNHNGLDNRRSNLRVGTPQQNSFNSGLRKNNTSGFKGVTFIKDCGRWAAQMNLRGKHIHLGRFSDPESAARAYDKAVIELFPDFAFLNFPDERPR